jgi:hypothetical protein
MERTDPPHLHRRARRAYELGRLRFAAPYGIAALIAVALARSAAGEIGPTFYALGFALVASCTGLAYLSRGFAAHVRSGLLAGTVPVIAASVSVRSHGCALDCSSLCAPLCVGAGLLMGAWLAHRSVPSWGLAIAILTTGVGCFPLGVGALLGALLGLALGGVPLLILRRT